MILMDNFRVYYHKAQHGSNYFQDIILVAKHYCQQQMKSNNYLNVMHQLLHQFQPTPSLPLRPSNFATPNSTPSPTFKARADIDFSLGLRIIAIVPTGCGLTDPCSINS